MIKAVLVFALICAAFAEYNEYRSLYVRDGVPSNSGWNILRKAEPEHRVKFTISLQQQNLAELERRFWENSDPNSPHFAKHMTKSEINELTAPSIKTQKRVLRWIYEVASSIPKGNVFDVDNQGDAIVIKSTVLFAEKLFKTEMHLFINERNNHIVCKHLGSLSIPQTLDRDITFVSGITELRPTPIKNNKKRDTPFVSEKSKSLRQTADNQCNVPYTIKNLYGVPQNLYITESASNASIYSQYEGQAEGFGLPSIEDYQQALGLPLNPITCILGNGDLDYVTNDTDGEANLDTEMMTGMAPNVKTCFYVMDEDNGWMYEFSREIYNTPNAPLVVSMSYGWNENEQCDNTSSAESSGLGNCTYYHIPDSQTYVNLTNVNFQKLGLIGHTILSSSGDAGVSGNQGSLNNCATQGPIFPAASPYVTAVGATSVEVSSSSSKSVQSNGGQPPICTNTFYQCVCSTSQNEQPALQNDTAGFDSGGGFSMYSPQPAYQSVAVQAYLKSGVVLPPSNYFNGNNRGYPDIAAVGENVCLLDPNSPCNFVGGTSAATPLIGALVTLLNNDRIAAGKTPLGFLNPIIYNMFYQDADKYFNNKFPYGNNNGGCPTDMGFNAKSGYWTPITGVGSPNFPNIRAYIATLK